jgi:hypothetical protein
MELAMLANDDPENNYFMFIDEINRANLPKVMGALMTIIETSKRYDPNPPVTKAWLDTRPPPPPAPTEYRVSLAHEEGRTIYLGLPNNLYIIGAMNTSDRSVIHLDGALRRRFSFLRIETMLATDGLDNLLQSLADVDDKGFWSENNLQNCRELFQHFVNLNEQLWKIIGPDAVLGHSYFFDAGWCKSPVEMFKEKCDNASLALSDDETQFMMSIFLSPMDPSNLTTRSHRHHHGPILPRRIVSSLVGQGVLVDRGTTPKSYSVVEAFDISTEMEQAFWQGFWDQYSYAILPQLADTLNAFAVENEKMDITTLNNITELFFEQSSDLESQRRTLRPPPEQGATQEWRVE